jgi:hypothetical protein
MFVLRGKYMDRTLKQALNASFSVHYLHSLFTRRDLSFQTDGSPRFQHGMTEYSMDSVQEDKCRL